MRKILLFKIFTILALLSLGSCDQNMLGAGYAIKNLVSTPFKAIGNAFSDRAYKKIQKKSTEKNSIPSECWVKRKPVMSGLQNIEEITEALRANVCSCVPWGSCTIEECPCSRLCPEGFDIFKRPGRKSTSDLSTKENSLSFINGRGGGEITSTQGFCWGHASVTNKFNRMAFFNKDERPKYSLFSRERDEQMKAIEYYKGLIDKVIDNKATSIPGIENLHQLSSIPGLQSYIADKVAHDWAQRAMSTNGLNIALKTKAMKKKQSEKLFKEIEDKLNLNQQPQIVFTKRDEAMTTHAVLVSHAIKEKDGSTTLCIRDNNRARRSISSVKSKCVDKMFIKSDGSIRYSEWGDLGGVEMAFNDNPDALSQLKNLKEHCNEEKGCKK